MGIFHLIHRILDHADAEQPDAAPAPGTNASIGQNLGQVRANVWEAQQRQTNPNFNGDAQKAAIAKQQDEQGAFNRAGVLGNDYTTGQITSTASPATRGTMQDVNAINTRQAQMQPGASNTITPGNETDAVAIRARGATPDYTNYLSSQGVSPEAIRAARGRPGLYSGTPQGTDTGQDVGYLPAGMRDMSPEGRQSTADSLLNESRGKGRSYVLNPAAAPLPNAVASVAPVGPSQASSNPVPTVANPNPLNDVLARRAAIGAYNATRDASGRSPYGTFGEFQAKRGMENAQTNLVNAQADNARTGAGRVSPVEYAKAKQLESEAALNQDRVDHPERHGYPTNLLGNPNKGISAAKIADIEALRRDSASPGPVTEAALQAHGARIPATSVTDPSVPDDVRQKQAVWDTTPNDVPTDMKKFYKDGAKRATPFEEWRVKELQKSSQELLTALDKDQLGGGQPAQPAQAKQAAQAPQERQQPQAKQAAQPGSFGRVNTGVPDGTRGKAKDGTPVIRQNGSWVAVQ